MVKVPKALYPYFNQVGITYHLKKNEHLYMQDGDGSTIFLITRGRVRKFYTTDTGKELTLQIMGAGQLIGESAFLAPAPRKNSISAVTDVTTIACPIDRLFPLMQNSPELNQVIIQLLSDNYLFLCNQLKRISVYDSTQKVASFLIEQTENSDLDVGIINNTLPYTHEELGVCLGLNRVTVTRILDEFKKKGLVDLSRKKIQVIDRAGLQTILKVPRE